MKKFVQNLVVFLVPFIIILVILEIRTRNLNTETSQKADYLEQHSNAIEILILGNSHAGDGIDPSKFGLNAFNAAMGSQSLYFDIEIAKKFLPKMTRLKYVLISMDYHSLYFTHEESRDFMYSHNYDIQYKSDKFKKSDLSMLFFGYGFETAFKLMFLSPPEKLNKGWMGYSGTDDTKMSETYARERVESFNELAKTDSKYTDEIVRNLNSFISLLKSRNIVPILISLPCHPYFIKHMDPDIAFDNKAVFQEISSQHDLLHLDYLKEPLPDSLFLNVDHLNRKGAYLISKKLNDTLSSIDKLIK